MKILSMLFFFIFQFLCAFLICFHFYCGDFSAITQNRRYKRNASNLGKCAIVLVFVFYVIFATFRSIDPGYGGMDIPNYFKFYAFADTSFAEFSQFCTMEIGYRFLIWSLSNIGLPFRAFLFLVHVFVFICIFLFIKHSYCKVGGMLHFLTTFLLCSELIVSFCLIRNSLALCLSLLFYILLDKKKYKLALIPLAVAISFHLSAIILAAVYILVIVMDKSCVQTKKPVFLWIGAFILAELWVIPVIDFVVRNTKYSFYLESSGLSIGTYLILGIVTVAVLLDKRSILINTTKVRYLLVAWLCFLLQCNYGIFYRTLLYFIPVLYVTIPDVYRTLIPAHPDNGIVACFKNSFSIDIKTRQITFNYVLVLKLILRVAILGYLIIRCIKLFTNDYISYGIYPYFSS